MRLAASRTFWTAGSRSPIRMAMIAMTTSNSIRVKAERGRAGGLGRVRISILKKQRQRVGVRRSPGDAHTERRRDPDGSTGKPAVMAREVGRQNFNGEPDPVNNFRALISKA